MKIIVRHDRDDKGWVLVSEGAFNSGGKVYKELVKALTAAHTEHPEAEVLVDDRTHTKMDNGLVMVSGELDYQTVEFT